MILKPREDRAASIAALEALMARPEARRHDIERLRAEINAIILGDMSEGKAAYVLDVHFGASRNWAVIHDLRIELDGLSAQIDHLLINRVLDIWVLESKRLASGIKVQDNGECLTFRAGRPLAIESPIEQNRRHVKMLQRLLDSGAVPLPRRLGMTIKPRLHSLVLVSDGRITRPRAPVAGIETLIRTDLAVNHVDAAYAKGNPFDLAKVIGSKTLENLGRQLVELHQPIEYDWERRFRLNGSKSPPPRLASAPLSQSLSHPAPEVVPPTPTVQLVAKPRPPAGQCDACQVPVSSGVKTYCTNNPGRFDSRILCMDCQSKMAAIVS